MTSEDRLRVKALTFAMCTLLLAFGCVSEDRSVSGGFSHGSAPVALDNWLSEELRSIPADYGNTFLWFANLRGAKEAAGASDYKGIETVMSEGKAPPRRVSHVFVWDTPGMEYAGQIYKEAGIDLWGFDSILWTGESSMHATSPHVTVLRGGFGSDIGIRLEQLEYESDTYRGIKWYFASTDIGVDIRKLRASPFSVDAAIFNAIAPVEDRLLIRRLTGNMQSQIEVHQGTQPSLWDERPHKELAQAMGNRLLAGAFVSPSNVQAVWSTFGYNLSPHWFPGFAPGSASWRDLDEYTVAIVGYSVMDEKEYTTFALHYDDSEGAERNATEFERRLKTAQIYLYNRSANAPEGNDETILHPPLASVCASLDIRAIKYLEYSVLVADCEAPDENNDIATIGGLTASSMWNHVLLFSNLYFLVPDVREERPWWQFLAGRISDLSSGD